MHRFWLALVVFIACFPARSAQAAWVVSIKDAEVAAGKTGFVDVYLQGDIGDQIDEFTIVFQIKTSGTTRLEFVETQSARHLTPPLVNQYVFNETGSGNLLIGSAGEISSNPFPNDTYTTADFALLGSATATGAPQLLARLDVTANTSLAPIAGNEFLIELDAAQSRVGLAGQFTPLAGSGTVTITADSLAVPTPEPGSALLLLTGTVGLSITRRRWRQLL